MTVQAQVQGHSLPPVRLAFIIDNNVVDVLHTDERLAAIFLSNPVVIDITEYENTETISIDSIYDPSTGQFTPAPPQQNSPQIRIDREDVIVED